MNAILNKKIESLIFILFIFGAFYRYLRIFPPFFFINTIPYFIEGIIIILININYFFKFHHTKISVSFFILQLISFVPFLINIIGVNLNSQLSYISDLVFPISIALHLVDIKFANEKKFRNYLGLFLFISFILEFLEFYTYNYLGAPIFNFSNFWEYTGNDEYHSSAVYYLFLGLLTRPWGVLAMPQATGSLFSIIATYFFVESRVKKIYTPLIISLLAIYVSGSRTAIITFICCVALFGLYEFKVNFKKNILKSSYLFVFYIFLFIVLSSFLIIIDKSSEKENFIKSFFNLINETFKSRNIIYIIFGFSNNLPLQSEFALLNNIFRFGLFNILFLLSLFMYLYHKYNHSIVKEIKSKDIIYLLVVINFLFASMHYDVFRYPANIIFSFCICFIINRLTLNKINEQKQFI